MAEDLADQIDEYICTFEGAGDLTMDTFVMLLFALIVVLISILFLSKLLYDKYVKKSLTSTDTSTATPGAPITSIGASSLLNNAPLKDGVIGTRASEPKEILASKKDAAVRQIKNDVFSSKSSFPQKSINASANVRKRLSRKSPGPDIVKTKKMAVPPSNINGQDPQCTQWAIHLFRWLYSDLVVVNKLMQDWVQSVNTALMSYAEQNEVIVEVVRVLPESLPPNLTNILCERTEQQPNEVELIFDIDTTPVMQIKAFKTNNQKTDVSHYKATVSKLKSRMSLIINYFALKGEMKIEGYPEVKIHLNSIGPLKTTVGHDEDKMTNLICDLLMTSMRDVVYPVDFSIYSTCPRILGEEPEEAPLDYSNYSQYTDNFRSYQDDTYNSGIAATPKKLLVKIVKAEGLLQSVEPHCVIEMDEPPQKNQTMGKPGINPMWDESFLFELSNHSTELLFEVYDRSLALGGFQKFLGLGLVGIDELSAGPASTQILELQPRPYETETITGTLTVEFVFIEGAQVPMARRPQMKNSFKMNGDQTYGRDALDHQDPATDKTPSSPKQLNSPTSQVNGNSFSDRNAKFQAAKLKQMVSNNSLLKPPPIEYNRNLRTTDNNTLSPTTVASQINNALSNNVTDPNKQKKPRNFFGAIKNKFTLGKNRSKSMDQENGHDTLHSTSAASTLSRRSSFDERRSHIFPTIRNISSRKSSISDSSAISGISNTSGKTYVHEESTLLLETIENNIVRHYLVPIDVARRQKWKRKGTKLHVYNDHTFVAKHLKGGLLCHVCNRSIPRRPGKQGYECRDCLLQCHKPCHVRAPQACTNPKILSVQLIKWQS